MAMGRYSVAFREPTPTQRPINAADLFHRLITQQTEALFTERQSSRAPQAGSSDKLEFRQA